MYRVAARKGAVVRKGIEMESSIAGIIEPGTRVVGEREATAACGTRRVFVRTAEVAGWLSLRVLEVDREAAKALEKREAQDRDARAKRLRGERLAAELARFVGRCGRLAPRELDPVALAGSTTFTSAAQLLVFWFGRQFYAGPASPQTAAASYFEARWPLWFGGRDKLFDMAQRNAAPLIRRARRGDLDGDPEWAGPRGALAKLLLLDQFPPGQEKGAKIPTSKAHIPVVFHSFWLIFRRVIISRNGLERERLSSERARAERPR